MVICCTCWSETLYYIVKKSYWGLSFWRFLCCFGICCHILKCSWWQFPLYSVLSVPAVHAPWNLQLLRIYSSSSFLSFLISSEIVQNVNNISRYWYEYINRQSKSSWGGWESLCSLKVVFHDSADSGFFPCLGNLGLDNEEDKSRVTSPPYNIFSDSNNNPSLEESSAFKTILGLHLFFFSLKDAFFFPS